MTVTLHENQDINRRLLRDNDIPCIKKLRSVLRAEGLDTTKRLMLDLSVPGLLRFMPFSDLHPTAFPFRFRPVSKEESYRHNLQESRKHGAKGNYFR